MANQFQTDYLFEPGIIKQEPSFIITDQTTTASVPIPVRRNLESDLRDYSLENENSSSPLPKEEQYDQTTKNEYCEILGSNYMWGNRPIPIDDISQMEPFKMDEDDLFQIDKADLIPDPTLAELNANDDLNLDGLDFDIIIPGEADYMTIPHPKPLLHVVNNNFQASSWPQPDFYREESVPTFSPFNTTLFSPASQHSSTSSLMHNTSPPPQVVRPSSSSRPKSHITLHELLTNSGTSPGSGSSGVSSVTRTNILSSSAPTHLGTDQIWKQAREPRKHLLSTGSLAEAGSVSSLSIGSVLSPEAQDFSHDEGFDSSHDEDSDRYDESSSDDSDDETGSKKSTKKEPKSFWQYNVQSKGPKGQRLVLKSNFEDPHVLNEITDPVFSPNCAVRGIKHSGKARKGDGNDLTPNPRKLCSIGKELEKLTRHITDMTPVSELPFSARPKTRKEKNKLASRACRLKKKAQHEANKLKLYGLNNEHRRLINGISQVKQILKTKVMEPTAEKQEEHTKQVELIVKSATKVRIAGHSTEYVNKVLERTKAGVPGGGIDDFI